MNLDSIIKKLSWHDFVIFGVIILFLFFQLGLISSFNQMPSPIYGGDKYHQLGAINHVKYGGSPFESHDTLNELPHYFPTYSLIVGNVAGILNISSMDSMFLCSYFFLILSIIIIYYLTYLVFRNKKVSLISSLLFNPLIYFPILKYTPFSRKIIFPLFFIFLFLTFTSKDRRKFFYAAITGIIYGIGSISHGSIFLILTLLIPFIFLYLIFFQYLSYWENQLRLDKKRMKNDFKTNTIIVLIIFFLGFFISLLYWFKPIFNYHLDVPNKITEISQTNYYGFKGFLDFTRLSIEKLILNFSSIFETIISCLVICSFFIFYFFKELRINRRFFYFIAMITFVIPYHFVLTYPLLGSDFSPDYMLSFLGPIFRLFFSGVTLYFIFKLLEKYKFSKIKFSNIFLVFLTILLLIFSISSFNTHVENDKWINAGKSSLSEHYKLVGQWLRENSQINDTVLTNKELGFAINSVTGRKIVAVPLGHTSIDYKINERELDLALMLYGKNDTLREKLFSKYNIEYFYWDYYWIRSEFIINEEGKIVGYFDPIEIIDTREHRSILEENNVSYLSQYIELNPNKRGKENIEKYNVLVILPSSFSYTQPWSEELDKYLYSLKEIESNNERIAELYSVNY